MTVLLIASTVDPASMNLRNTLLQDAEWDEINTFCTEPVYQHRTMQDVVMITIQDSKIQHEYLDREIEDELTIKPRQAIFISRHTSKTGRPTLTVHPVGNYGDAQFGGKPKTLVQSSPRLMAFLLRIMRKNLQQTDLTYEICFEVTHHGPYLDIPTFFVEIGSTENEWRQQAPATIIVQSLLELLESYHYEQDCPDDIPVLLGVGGGHYAPRFTDVVFEKKAAFGHMIPSYQINAGVIDQTIIEQAIQTTPNLQAVYFHRKALKKSQIREYKQLFQNLEIPALSSNDLPCLE